MYRNKVSSPSVGGGWSGQVSHRDTFAERFHLVWTDDSRNHDFLNGFYSRSVIQFSAQVGTFC